MVVASGKIHSQYVLIRKQWEQRKDVTTLWEDGDLDENLKV